MASIEHDGTPGRRTRSGRKVTPATASTTPRSTRRSSKKSVQEQIVEHTPHIGSEEQTDNDYNQESDVMKAMYEDVMQDGLINCDDNSDQRAGYGENIIEEYAQEDVCIVYEEQEPDNGQNEQEQIEEYVLRTEIPVPNDTAIDEKSSSFPFGALEQSETSEEVQEEPSEGNQGNGVESSLLASLAGDNANSLPSVAGGEETECKVIEQMHQNSVKMESDDSSSQPAIAEEIGGNASDATIVNAEMVSEDELPLPTKPEINDAEEVSDDELPAPQRAELPADAEVISEDELPSAPSAEKKSSTTASSRHKRRVDDTDQHTEKHHNRGGSAKSKLDEQYNPMSPTSESNDAPPVEKKPKLDAEESTEGGKDKKKEKEREKDKDKEKDKEKEKEKKRLPDLDKYWRAVKDDPADFTGWTYLLQYVDNESDAEAAREAYDAFLSHYPYCYGYWRKYADYEKRKGIKANCNTVFERGLEAIPLSVDLWIHYLSHVKSMHADHDEIIRKEFERAIGACGLEFRSDKLWDAYIRWESEAKRYQRVVQIYDRLLGIPTQGYNGHFDNFQDLINQHSITSTISPEEIKKLRIELREAARSTARSKPRRSNSKDKDVITDASKSPTHNRESSEKEPAASNATTATTGNECIAIDNNNEKAIAELSDLNTLTDDEIAAIKEKVISSRRKLHKNTVAAVTARWSFEEGIKRPYFHVKPLERCQLKNWKDYLDFEIEQGDRTRVLVLFERCLIACALYDEFWLKMVRYLESHLDEPNIVATTRDVYRRACEIHHPDKPSLHLMWAAFEECQSNFDRAAEVLVSLEKRCPNLLQVAYRRINVERRRGDLDKCRELYEHYITTAKNKNIAGSLAIKYARFLNKICNDLDGGLRMLQQALDRDSANARVALQMIDLALQRPHVNEEEVVQIMDKFMSRESIDPEQKVLFAQRKVEFLEDFGSTAKGLQDAQRALQLALNKANEAKKKREKSSTASSSSKESTAATNATAQSAYNNNGSSAATANTNYNYNSTSSTYYGQQNTYQQQSYDGYYNHWQYGTGYNNYGQWSGYGNYY